MAIATACLFISEVSPQKLRGYFGAFVQLFISFGILLSYLLGFGVLYNESFYRIMLWVGFCLALGNGVAMSFFKESPRHFLRKNDISSASKI
jgi:SP family sugar:H+ symporter-like MFS transporter